MVKPFDVSKLRNSLTKNISGISVGFKDPSTWVSTGNYALNYRISGDFFNGVPLGKVTIIAGEPGSGKSYLSSGNIIREAQKQDIFCVLVDSENALDEKWLKSLGVDTSENKLLKINAAMIDDVAKIISDFVKDYAKSYENVKEENRPKILFVIDSLGMLLTPTDVSHFEEGDLKGDMGRKPKALKALITNCVNSFANHEFALVCTNHTYESQDMFNPDQKISGGAGPIFAASIVVATRQLKLKEDEEGNKTSEVMGIRAMCKIMKTRFNKPFETVEVKIPYESGMDPYSGLLELFEKEGIVEKDGNKLRYVSLEGKEYKEFRKNFVSDHDLLDLIMREFKDKRKKLGFSVKNPEVVEEENEEENEEE